MPSVKPIPAQKSRILDTVNGVPSDCRQESTAAVHFGANHVLADAAVRRCRTHLLPLSRAVACGPCWELAVRADERFAVEFGLPRELVVDPDYVDEIAVDLACRGERVELTGVELVVAVERLQARRMSRSAIAARLHKSFDVIAALVDRIAGDSAASTAQAA